MFSERFINFYESLQIVIMTYLYVMFIKLIIIKLSFITNHLQTELLKLDQYNKQSAVSI